MSAKFPRGGINPFSAIRLLVVIALCPYEYVLKRSLTSAFSARTCKAGKSSRHLLSVDDLVYMLKD